MKNSNDTIANRTRDLPACSAVRQSTEPPPLSKQIMNKPLNCVRNFVSNYGVFGRGENVKIRVADKCAMRISGTDI